MNLLTAVRRAFNVNPKSLPMSAGEAATLAAGGVNDPTIRSFLVWRRSVMLFVVISAVIGAGLASYREYVEVDDRPEMIDTLADRLALDVELVAPAVKEAQKWEEEEVEEDEDEGTAKPQASATPGENEDVGSTQTAFAQFTDVVQLVALYALPIAALAVVVLWTRFVWTQRIIVAAFGFAFLIPLIIALCPWSWWGYVEPTYSPKTEPLKYLEQAAEGLLEGGAYLITLLPTVISLVPGVQRAGIRMKLLLPQSTLPGWFLVVASPFYALFLLVIFVAINQIDTHPLAFAGLLLFLLAPLIYPVFADVFTRPLITNEDLVRIRRVQRVVGLLTAFAGLLLAVYLATREFLGIRVLGIDHKTALMNPLDVVEFLLEVLNRSMFLTVLWADLFMRMNLKAWRHAQEFAGTPAAENYGTVMQEFGRVSQPVAHVS